MATVDELKILIKAETKDLKKGLDNVNRSLKKTSKEADKAGQRMKAAFRSAKIGLAATAAAGGLLTKKIAEVGAGFEDLKTSLDVVFGGKAGGAAAFERIIEFAQTTPFQIEDVTRSFISLKASGVEPTQDMMNTFANAASVAIDSLGAFDSMVRLVQKSAAGGLGIEELEQLDQRGIPATKILSDALGKTRLELGTFGQTAQGSAKMVELLIQGLKDLFPDAMDAKMENLSTKTSNLEIAFRGLADEIYTSGLDVALKAITDEMTNIVDRFSEFIRVRKQNAGSVFYSIFGQGQAPNTSGLENLPPAAKAKPKVPEKPVVTATIAESEFVKEFQQLLKDTVPESERLQAQIDLINEAVKRGATDKLGNPLFDPQEAEKVKKHLQDQIDELEGLETGMEALAPVIAEATNKFTNDFVQALMDGENAMDSFKNLFKDMARQIIASALQMQVIKPIMDAMFTAVGLPVKAAAGGGRVQKGMPTLVGERGAEIFIPNTGGTIMNNMNTKNALSGGGGVTVVQNNNFALGVGATARAEVAKLLPQIQESSKAAVLEAAARGGSFRRGLMGG